MTDEAKVYAVSYGNGNDGVSHMFPDFYCRTDKPYELARLAIITSMRDEFQSWAAVEVEVDGAWMIAEVFADDYGPDPADPWATPIHDGLEACFGADVLAAFPDKP